MRGVLKTLAAALVIGLVFPSLGAAQGGGASNTGTIQGRVADSSGGLLPGVTVRALFGSEGLGPLESEIAALMRRLAATRHAPARYSAIL